MNITAQQRDWGSHGMSCSHKVTCLPPPPPPWRADVHRYAATKTESPQNTEALLPSGQVSGYWSLGGPSIRRLLHRFSPWSGVVCLKGQGGTFEPRGRRGLAPSPDVRGLEERAQL